MRHCVPPERPFKATHPLLCPPLIFAAQNLVGRLRRRNCCTRPDIRGRWPSLMLPPSWNEERVHSFCFIRCFGVGRHDESFWTSISFLCCQTHSLTPLTVDAHSFRVQLSRVPSCASTLELAHNHLHKACASSLREGLPPSVPATSHVPCRFKVGFSSMLHKPLCMSITFMQWCTCSR
jgi:hypothetical protein